MSQEEIEPTAEGNDGAAAAVAAAAAEADVMLKLALQYVHCRAQRLTRPEASPPMSASTSSRDEKLKSPLMECLRQEAATAYLTASWGSDSSAAAGPSGQLVVGRGHASLSTNVDTRHSKLVRGMGCL